MMTPARPAVVKDIFRREALERRDALAPDLRAQASEAIAERGIPVFLKRNAWVSGFWPIRTEISPLPLLRKLAEAGARLCLPAIVARGKPLSFRAWALGDDLQRGQWGIREPLPDARQVEPDLVLAPLAAFDRRGDRVGYGAAYYDLTLNALRAAKPITAIGLAFATQEVEAVPMEPHDARLDFILTERETIDCRQA
jgi:5-formyltetrahydrofolate cyclo-ligase